MKQTLEAQHKFVENIPDLEILSVAILPTNSEIIICRLMEIPLLSKNGCKWQFHITNASVHLQELINEQSLDKKCLVNQQRPLGETDTTITYSPGNNVM